MIVRTAAEPSVHAAYCKNIRYIRQFQSEALSALSVLLVILGWEDHVIAMDRYCT